MEASAASRVASWSGVSWAGVGRLGEGQGQGQLKGWACSSGRAP